MLLLGIGSIIAAILIVLGISDAGYSSTPLLQRILYALPFLAFAGWAFRYEYRLSKEADENSMSRTVQWLFLLLLIASIVMFAFSSTA